MSRIAGGGRPLQCALVLCTVSMMFAGCGSPERDFDGAAGGPPSGGSSGAVSNGAGNGGRANPGGGKPGSGGEPAAPDSGAGGQGDSAGSSEGGGDAGGQLGGGGGAGAGVGGTTAGASSSGAGPGGAAGCGGTSGACMVCQPKAYRCNGAVSEQCSSDGKAYALDRACGAVGCNAVTGRCNQCNPTQAQCGSGEYCDSTNCTSSGYCAVRPAATSTSFDPQCGCDGVSYWNGVHAHWLGKTAFKGTGNAGTCNAPKQCLTASSCGANESCITHVQDYYCTTTPVYGFCMAKPIGLTTAACTGQASSGNGEQQCGGTCISFCTAYRLGTYTTAEGCGA